MTNHEMRPFSQSLPMALLRSREAVMRRFRPILAAHELTEQQWRVLRALASTDEAFTVGELVEQTFLLGPSLSRILANLKERGLIERNANQKDQRSALLVLTNEGAAMVAKIAPGSEAAYSLIENEFGAKRLAHLFEELGDLAGLDTSIGQADALEEAS